jgi:DNA-binding NarL/FixJ family response regulator
MTGKTDMRTDSSLHRKHLSGSRHRTTASYERELERHRANEAELRTALAKAEELLRQEHELVEQHQAFRKHLDFGDSAAEDIASLSPRQRQIMELILAGHANKNIASDLGISQRTVENHRASIMKKTGSKSLPALVRSVLAAAWSGICERGDDSAENTL